MGAITWHKQNRVLSFGTSTVKCSLWHTLREVLPLWHEHSKVPSLAMVEEKWSPLAWLKLKKLKTFDSETKFRYINMAS